MKPSEALREAAMMLLEQAAPSPSSELQHQVNEVRAFVRFTLGYLDDVEARLTKLEAVDGAPRVRCFMPLCNDGRPVHDMQGQARCPSCGYAPRPVQHEPDPAEPEQ
jgi:hypothetical protein